MTLLNLFETLENANSIVQIEKSLKKFLEAIGIFTFSFTYYSFHPGIATKIIYDFCSKNFESWHKHYLEEKYEDIDTTLDFIYQNPLPVFWDLQEQLANATTKREKQMRLDSIAFGIEKGLSIPIHGPNEEFAILLVVQTRGQTHLNNWIERQNELIPAGHYFYAALKKQLLLTQKHKEHSPLSQREKQCLELIAKRVSNATIAKTLNISERTVNFHIQNINKKLKTKNKYQSLAKAVEMGIL